jgi:hypothetical protein
MTRAKWIAITAGVGSSNFEAASKRVARKIRKFQLFDEVICSSTKDLETYCPATSLVYKEFHNSNSRGYGFMSYKSELVHNAFSGFWGDFDGVLWVDAGCDVLVNDLSRLRLKRLMKYAELHGAAFFTLDTPEISFTKRDFFRFFPKIDPYSAGPQIQTTWFLLYGELGKSIAKEWLSITVSNKSLIDLSPSVMPEFPEFVENRYDQSAFSLICKSRGLTAMKYQPSNGGATLPGKIRAGTHPFWTSRNRSGKSTIPFLFLLTENFAFFKILKGLQLGNQFLSR